MSGYIRGKDLLLKVGDKCVGHCSTHTITFNSDTKERAVKPAAEQGKKAGLFKNKSVNMLSISVNAEGLRVYNETENGFEEISAMWGKGTSVSLSAFKREKDEEPYLSGNFVITSIEETSSADDDATYSVSLENDGEPDVYPGKEVA